MPYAPGPSGRLYYEETGEGFPIIFAHELAADCRTWEAQVRFLSRHYRCIVYNAIGYPHSDLPRDPEAYGWERQRDAIPAIMDHLGVAKAHLVGLSMGAYAALQCALAHPGRVASVAFSAGGSVSTPKGAPPDNSAILALTSALGARGWEGADYMREGPSRVQLQNKDPRGWAQFCAQLHEHPLEGTILTLENYQGKRPSLYEREEDFRRMQTPVLLMAGDEDDAVLAVNLFLKRVIPRAGLWIAPKTGHAMNLEEPAAYNQMLLDFFSAVERGSWGARDPRSLPA